MSPVMARMCMRNSFSKLLGQILYNRPLYYSELDWESKILTLCTGKRSRRLCNGLSQLESQGMRNWPPNTYWKISLTILVVAHRLRIILLEFKASTSSISIRTTHGQRRRGNQNQHFPKKISTPITLDVLEDCISKKWTPVC